MKNTLCSSVLVFLSIFSFASSVHADNAWSLGGGLLLQNHEPDEAYSRGDESTHLFPLLTAGYQHKPWLRSTVSLYSGSDGDITATGVTYQLQALRLFMSDRVELYAAPGIFHESRLDRTAKYHRRETFSGFSLSGGAAKLWPQWRIDFALTIRENSDYVDYYEARYVDVDKHVNVLNSQLTVSYRF